MEYVEGKEWCTTWYTLCKEEGKRAIYIGESARTSYDRGVDHLRSVERRDQDHPMVSHYREVHPEVDQVWMEMKVVSHQEKNLYRQSLEGHLISTFKGDHLLNGRGDCGQNMPPTLEVERPSFHPPTHPPTRP